MNLGELESKNKEELVTIAREMGIENGIATMRKDEVVFRVMQNYAEQQGYILAAGILEIINDGYGFLRQPGLRPGSNDVYISQSQIRRFGLRTVTMCWVKLDHLRIVRNSMAW